MLSCNYIHMYIFVHRGIVMGHLLERVSPPKCQTNRSLKVSKSPRVTTSQQSLWKHHISRPSAIPTEKFHGYPFCPFKSKGNPSSHLKASGMTMTSTVEATPSTGPFLTSLFLCQVLSLQCRMLWCLKNRQIVGVTGLLFLVGIRGWDPRNLWENMRFHLEPHHSECFLNHEHISIKTNDKNKQSFPNRYPTLNKQRKTAAKGHNVEPRNHSKHSDEWSQTPPDCRVS